MNRHLWISLFVLILALGPAALADAAGNGFGSGAALAAGSERALAPEYHDMERDGPVFMTRDTLGAMWAVWSYKSGTNIDIAVSRIMTGQWTVPVLVGAGNNVEDLDPRLIFLEDGSALLVWWQRGGGLEQSRVSSAYLVGGSWSEPERLSPLGVTARSPTIFDTETGDPLIGYIVEEEDGSSSVYLTPSRRRYEPRGGANGPDPIPTIGDGEQEENGNGWRRARWTDPPDS